MEILKLECIEITLRQRSEGVKRRVSMSVLQWEMAAIHTFTNRDVLMNTLAGFSVIAAELFRY